MTRIPNFAGSIRRSQMTTTYGPGAILNIRAPDGAPISAIAGGLDVWDQEAKPPGLRNRQRCHLSRLERKLGVDGFRLPPVNPVRRFDSDRPGVALTAKRFPDWLTCPKCFRLKPSRKWRKNTQIIGPARWCGHCSRQRERVYAVPVRFVLACNNGHLSEFPWRWWLTHRSPANSADAESGCDHANLTLRQGTSMSLSSLFLRCEDCGLTAPMTGVFGPESFRGFSCRGQRPWLGDGSEEECFETPRAVQRNSSSLYLPRFESALDIPPWTHTLEQRLGDWWPRLYRIDDSETRLFKIKANLEDINEECETNYSAEELEAEITKLKTLDEESDPDLRVDEYRQFTSVDRETVSTEEFRVRPYAVPISWSPFVDKILAVERLREVRANVGFTRLKDSNPVCDLSSARKNWLPAVEVRGEGIFVNLRQDYVTAWENRRSVAERISGLARAYTEEADRRDVPEEHRVRVTGRTILIHTFSHLLIREIALECGYSAASLRERIYDSPEMTGLLIYTSTPDSEGTLGGLSRLAESSRIESILDSAVESSRWCSSDPLCIEGVASLSEPLNLAACHACLLLPETSCEKFNLLLDRAIICGLPEANLAGAFESPDSEP